MIDVDGLDYCQRCRMPLLLVEAARDCKQEKQTIVLEKLAAAANVPAVCVLWTPSGTWNPEPPHCECQDKRRRIAGCDHGIESFRWRRIYPMATTWETWTADAMASWVDRIHADHERNICRFAPSKAA